MSENIFDKKQRVAREQAKQRRINGAIKASKADKNKLVTREFVGAVIQRYHNETVSPILLSHEERLTYLQMWPHQKLWYHWLKLRHWLTVRWQAIQKARYVRRWYKKDAEVTERMAAGETIEGDE